MNHNGLLSCWMVEYSLIKLIEPKTIQAQTFSSILLPPVSQRTLKQSNCKLLSNLQKSQIFSSYSMKSDGTRFLSSRQEVMRTQKWKQRGRGQSLTSSVRRLTDEQWLKPELWSLMHESTPVSGNLLVPHRSPQRDIIHRVGQLDGQHEEDASGRKRVAEYEPRECDHNKQTHERTSDSEEL